jgi:hypothetical protein
MPKELPGKFDCPSVSTGKNWYLFCPFVSLSPMLFGFLLGLQLDLIYCTYLGLALNSFRNAEQKETQTGYSQNFV